MAANAGSLTIDIHVEDKGVETIKNLGNASEAAAQKGEQSFRKMGEGILTVGRSAEVVEKDLSRFQTMMADRMTGSLMDFIDGTKTAEEAFGDFAQKTIRWLGEMAIKRTLLSGMSSLFSGIGGASTTGATGAVMGFAEGGMITEPILGVGANTGRAYSFAERGPEMVTPMGKDGVGATVARPKIVNIIVNNEAEARQAAAQFEGAVVNVIRNKARTTRRALAGA
jgi:hypothetical protein